MKSIDDLVALAKKKPDGLNFGSPGVGTPSHLAAEKLMVAKGIKAQFVHYKGGAPMMTDLIAGRLDAAWPSAPLARSFIQNEKIKAIALDGAQRWKLIPDVPTLREAGFDLAATGWYGLFAPAKTPPDVIERYNKAIVDAVRSPEFKDRMLAFGLQPTGTSAAAFADIVQDDSALWVPAIKASGFKADE